MLQSTTILETNAENDPTVHCNACIDVDNPSDQSSKSCDIDDNKIMLVM